MTKTVEEGWFLPRSALTQLAADSLSITIDEAKQSHIVDLRLRLGGKDAWRQADWVKYLRPVPSE